jgi:putative NADH-flavin reductase
MKVLVFGAGGNFGRTITDELDRRGHAVVVAGRHLDPSRPGAVRADATDAAEVAGAALGVGAIVVAVGARSGDDPGSASTILWKKITGGRPARSS